MKRLRLRLAAVAAVLALAAAPGLSAREARAGGAVASADPLATAAALDVLRAGGNAADAAVAAALVLAVVFPQAGNLGGGGFAVVKFGDQVQALDFRETAPAAATRSMFLDASGGTRPKASLVGPLAAGVPGSPAGLHELHRRYGRLPWRDVVAPAERLARRGFAVGERLVHEIAEERTLLATFRETAAVWLPGGAPPAVGARVRQPDLARTLRAYARLGPRALQEGAVAEAIVAASRAHGGVLEAGDLAAYRPVWREPVRFRIAGFEAASMPLPSSGGIILAQASAMLERLGWPALPRDGADRVHLMAETLRRAFADRFLLGDPAAVAEDVTRGLLAPDWIAARAASVDRTRATPSRGVRSWPAAEVAEHAETTHLSVVDAERNLVALTTTLNGSFGCGLRVRGAGFLLNNEMDDFTTAPGRPNLYGLIQGEANAVAPGKRMLSSMSPTVAWRGDECLALGSPGGAQIPTAVLQVLLAALADGLPLQEAVARPRVHHQWQPDEIAAEAGALDVAARGELERRGHRVRLFAPLSEVHAVRVDVTGRLEAAADARGPGSAGVAPVRE